MACRWFFKRWLLGISKFICKSQNNFSGSAPTQSEHKDTIKKYSGGGQKKGANNNIKVR